MNINDILNNAFAVSIFKKLKKEQSIQFEQLKEDIASVTSLKGDIGPMGPVGSIGPAGPKGMIGPRGEAGLKGDKGEKGNKGDKGDTGQTGSPGPQGAQGERGATGSVGPMGHIGLQGEKGDKGDMGSIGPIGPKGDKGDIGDIGPTGLIGPKGEKGDKGDIGAIGPKGDKGDTGPKGDKGKDGKSVKKEELLSYIDESINSTRNKLQSLQEDYTQVVNADTTSKLEQFKRKFREEIDKILEQHKKFLDMKVAQSGWGSTSSGGGSVNILQMDDVEFKKRHEIEGNAILIFDAEKKLFVSESFNDIIERLQIGMEKQYDRLVDTAGIYTYIGEADPGTSRSAALWRIKRVYENGDDVEIIWANNSADFTFVWNNRTTYDYS